MHIVVILISNFDVVIYFEVPNKQIKHHLEELASYLQSWLESDNTVSNAECSTSNTNVTWLVQNADCITVFFCQNVITRYNLTSVTKSLFSGHLPRKLATSLYWSHVRRIILEPVLHTFCF